MFTVLLVDDDPQQLECTKDLLNLMKVEVLEASSGEEALALVKKEKVDVIISDLVMSGMSGLDLLVAVQRNGYDIPIIIVTGYASLENAEQCISLGSFEYIAKPYDAYTLQAALQKALQNKKGDLLGLSSLSSSAQQQSPYHFPNIIGKSPQMQEIFAKVIRVADSSANVCLYGESGTGKELIARALHYHSPRHDRALVTLDCTAIPEGLMESEMFGHVRGAFTSAATEREGVFELADGGTLFLDEIGKLSLPLQAKLLRVLQCQEFRKVGGNKPIKVDVRIITATNKDLRKAVQEGTFREDLFYRIDVISLTLPPLRERKEDIPLLVEFFIDQFNRRHRKSVKGITSTALSQLMEYEWPGNVRQLENCIESAVVLTDGAWLTSEDIMLSTKTSPRDPSEPVRNHNGPFQSLVEIQQAYIRQVLRAVGGNKRQAARILQISPATLYHKLRQPEPLFRRNS